MEVDLKIDDVAKMTEGYSGSDMRDICQSVQLRVVSEVFDQMEEWTTETCNLDQYR